MSRLAYTRKPVSRDGSFDPERWKLEFDAWAAKQSPADIEKWRRLARSSFGYWGTIDEAEPSR